MTQASEPDFEERLASLEQRLRNFDDVVAERCLAILDVTGELHRQALQRTSQEREQALERHQQALDRLDRIDAQIERVWDYLLRERPNGDQPEA